MALTLPALPPRHHCRRRCRRCAAAVNAAAAPLPPQLRCRNCAAATALPQLRCCLLPPLPPLLPPSLLPSPSALRCRRRFRCWSLDFNDFISHSKKREAGEEGKNKGGPKKMQ
jgi:hypothetical protein